MFRQPRTRSHVDCHRDRCTSRERLERGRETIRADNGRVYASRELAQLVERARQSYRDVVEFGGELVQLGRDLGLRRPYLERERDESLLRAVVQVTLDAAPGLVGGGDDPGAGRLQLSVRLGIGNRGRDELGEPG